MANKKVSDIGAVRNALFSRQIAQPAVIHGLPDIPVLPATLLRLELKSLESAVDLREVSEIILSDLGASLQIFRYAGQECGSVVDAPSRIEDCISILGLHGCVDAISRKMLTKNADHAAAIDLWIHSKCIADLCALLASEMNVRIRTETIYLTGLFHEIGSLPAILGWDCFNDHCSERERIVLEIAEAWCLPRLVVGNLPGFRGLHDDDCRIGIVERAHRIMSSSRVSVPMGDTICLGCVHVD